MCGKLGGEVEPGNSRVCRIIRAETPGQSRIGDDALRTADCRSLYMSETAALNRKASPFRRAQRRGAIRWRMGDGLSPRWMRPAWFWVPDTAGADRSLRPCYSARFTAQVSDHASPIRNNRATHLMMRVIRISTC